MPGDLGVVVAIAALGGAAVGVERQWSGHASGPSARLGGVRTFTLLGATAGMAGTLWRDAPVIAAILVAGAVGLVVAAYVTASRRDVDATTEVAALVVVAAGVLDGVGELRLASGVIAITWLLLLEKSRLHDLVRRIDDAEMRAAARFAVMAVVILPLLPAGPYGPWAAVRPRTLWIFVLLFSGLSFAGYVARRVVGGDRGDVVAGLLGGLVSSTAVTFGFARASRTVPASTASLAAGTIAASTVMFARLLAATSVLQPSLARAAAPMLLVACAVGGAVVFVAGRAARPCRPAPPGPGNPFDLGLALQMAAVLQIVLFMVAAVRERWGDAGLLVTSVLVGLTDTDALTIATTTAVAGGVSPAVGAQALAYGSIANTFFKLAVAGVLGAPAFARRVAAGLVVLGATVLAASLLLTGR